MNRKKIIDEVVQGDLIDPSEIDREYYPVLQNLSSAFTMRFLPVPDERKNPEFIYVKEINQEKRWMEINGFVTQWNHTWEPAHLRLDMFYDKVPGELEWLKSYENANIYLLPYHKESNYYAFQHILNLLPAKTRINYNLPLFKKGIWPSELNKWYLNRIIQANFDEKLSKAFAFHIWPLINKGSKISAFSKNDPLLLLSHNLNYWLPFMHKLIEEKLMAFPRVEFEDEKQRQECEDTQKAMPKGIAVVRPKKGGMLWYGEDEAWQFTKELFDYADKNGNLRALIDTVKSNRIKDDFSEKWSYAKEDFERKIYHKRNKVKVTFVEIDNALPVHSPSSEVIDNLLWEDFITLLDKKEKRIVVCLKNGVTELTKISELLGYANHSPVSKAMAKIRGKAIKLLDLK